MNLRLFYILLGSLGMYLIPLFSYASVVYTPGLTISMTGSTTDVRFDVTEVLNDEGASATSPKLDTTTLNFGGSFYMTGIGWGLFQTGVYQVGLDCGSSPDFSALPSICRLTGTGWSETIGELGFSGAEYIPSSGTLSGSIVTWIGNISLSGIYLPLKPAYLTVDLNNSLAKHDHTLTISGTGGYGEGGTWEILKEPQKAYEPVPYFGGFAGVFSSVDFSLADDYDITITDPNGGTTKSRIKIVPGGLSFSLLGGGPYFSETFCNNHADKCPDGNTLSPTELVRTGNNLVGDGESYYHFRLRSRDQYGNRINTGKVKIKYITTVKTNQVDNIDTVFPQPDFSPSLSGDAAIVSSGVVLNNLLDGTSESVAIPMNGQDILYSIASIAPTDAGNVIQLDSIDYIPDIGPSIPLIGLDTTPLTFRPWFTILTTSTIPAIHIGEDHAFQVDVTSNSTRVDTPSQIYTFLTIGDGLFAAFRDFTSLDTIDCQAYPQDPPSTGVCNWPLLQGDILPSIVKIDNTLSFTFTGSYAPMTRYPIEETVKSKNIIGYTGLDAYGVSANILYHNPTPSNFGKSLFQDSNVKILGSSNGGREYGDIWLEGNGKAKFLDALRQKITLLSRNRTNYDNTDYLVINGDFTLTGGSFATKRSIIVLGGNATFTENIDKKDTSLALVVLSSIDGIGGNITIDPSVTDLNVSLITDRHITTSGDKQLYIYGSLISSNTLGDTLARICPYYVTVVCDATEAKKYDLENLRKNFRELSDTTGKTAVNPQAIGYPHTPIIIEHDMRILNNPPPGL